jgi:hypothetical protein
MVVYVPERTPWEYRAVSVKGDALQQDKPNELGRGAWELVAITPRQGGIDYVFKRPAAIEIDTGAPRAEHG